MKEQEEKPQVKSLWTLALQSSLNAVKATTDKFAFESLYDLYDICKHDDEKWKKFVLNNKVIKDLIKFHQPHREFLRQAKKSDEYRTQEKNWLDSFHSFDFLKMVLWLCFENEEATQLKHWSINPEHVFECAILKRAGTKLLNCKVAAMELGGTDGFGERSFEEHSSTLALIPYVEDLRIQIWGSTKSTYKTRLFEDVISQFKYLKSFKTGLFQYNPTDVNDFCAFVDKSPKILESLEIQYENSNPQKFAKLIRSLNNLPLLKAFNLDLSFGSQDVTEELIKFITSHLSFPFKPFRKQKTIQIKTVRKMKLWTSDALTLKLISKLFKGLTTLSLIYKRPIRTLEQVKGRNLENLKSIETLQLRLIYYFDYRHPDAKIRLSTIWKIFPGLKVFDTTHLDAEDEDFPEVLSLEKLIVLSGYISHPRLLLKMPNLKEFVILTDGKYAESAKDLKPYLPSKCKMLKIDYFEPFSNEACLAINSL